MSKCKVKNNQNKDNLLLFNADKSVKTSYENIINASKDTIQISAPNIEIQPTNFCQSSNNMFLMNGNKFTEGN